MLISRELLVSWLLCCQNTDGGFGCIPGAESHAGHVFCCLATLTLLGEPVSILSTEEETDKGMFTDELRQRCIHWLVTNCIIGPEPGDEDALDYDDTERDFVCGRRGKRADTCYSFWVGCSARLLGICEPDEDDATVSAEVTPFNKERILYNVLHRNSQHPPGGGVSSHPEKAPDIFHTFFGLSGVAALVGVLDPRLALPLGVR